MMTYECKTISFELNFCFDVYIRLNFSLALQVSGNMNLFIKQFKELPWDINSSMEQLES